MVGGPVGRRARPHRFWTPVRVLLAVFAVVGGLALLQKYPCGETHWSNSSVRYQKMCYSDVPYLYTGRGFAERRWPYGQTDGRYPAMEYPVLISYFAWGAAEITGLMPSGPSLAIRSHTPPDAIWGLPGMATEVNTYFLVTAVLLLCCGLGTVFFLAGASPGRPWDAMAFALSPTLLVSGLVNWDLIAVLFTAGALWAWARGRPILAGAMVGLGTAAKLYPLFLLGAFAVHALYRGRGDEERRPQPERLVLAVCGAATAWLAVNIPAIVSGLPEWKVFWTFNSHRGADLGSLWLVLQQNGTATSPHTINVVSGVAFALACAAIAVLGFRAPRRPQVAQVAFLVVAAFLIVNKVYSPQYVLWLLPLAALARPRWRDLLIWQAGELLYFGAVWLYLGGWLAPASGGDSVAYQLAILIRVAAEIFLMVQIARDMLAPAAPFEEWADDPDDPEDAWDEGSADGDVVEGRGGHADAHLDPVPDSGRVDV